jgi:DNA mismatch repair protein MutL
VTARVRVLPEDLANQIAAGEVVERPASVVKELIENAIDAGGRRISIDVEQGGVALVRVADDGLGMDREDAPLAVLRHATSKLSALDDLLRIESFGFRGEALPSIASVSRFTLRTRRREDDEGTLVRIEGGGQAEVAPTGAAPGTVVEVRDLFFNVPARRKFLKATGTESARVTEVVQCAALSEPEVTLFLTRDGRSAGEWLRASSREERVHRIFAGEELAACRGERGPLVVEAFLSRPERARPGATSLFIFVNGRPVRDRMLARSIALAYGSVLEPGRYPLGAVYLSLPADRVDVNVHPQKAEVRFADARAVGDALYKVIARSIACAFGTPGGESPPPAVPSSLSKDEERGGVSALVGELNRGISLGKKISSQGAFGRGNRNELGGDEKDEKWVWRGGAGAEPGAGAARTSVEVQPSAVPQGSGTPEASGPPPQDAGDPWGLSGDSPPPKVPYPTAAEIATRERAVVFGALQFVAQVRGTFLICEGKDGLYLLDQHAAAERVTFHRLRRGYDAHAVPRQALLFPVIVSVSPSEVALVEEVQEAIGQMGLEVRAAGAAALAVHAVPSLLPRASPEQLLRDLLGEVSHAGERAFSGAIDRAIATMACHGSIRAGDPVPPEEARALLAALDEVDFAGHCPHGRPVVMRIGWGELEHRVGRR